MEFDWLDAPFDLRKISPKEIEESFEDPFSLRLLPEAGDDTEKARYFNLGKSVSDRGIFTIFWTVISYPYPYLNTLVDLDDSTDLYIFIIVLIID